MPKDRKAPLTAHPKTRRRAAAAAPRNARPSRPAQGPHDLRPAQAAARLRTAASTPSAPGAVGAVAAPGRKRPARDPKKAAADTLARLLKGRRIWSLTAAGASRSSGLKRLQALMEASRSLSEESPADMISCARLAVCAADRLRAREHGSRVVADLRGLAWAELANAYRVCDDLHSAAGAMHRAVYWCRRGSGSDLLLARVAELLASLLGYQRQAPQGRELLALAYESHASAWRWRLAGRMLINEGVLALYDHQTAQALVLQLRGLDLLDLDADRELVNVTIWNLIGDLVDLGRFRAARRLLWRCRALFDGIEPCRVRWLEGTILAGLGKLDSAEAAFQQARQEFTDRQQIYPAARIGLQLALLWSRQGRVAEVYSLCEDVVETFRALRIGREAIAALLVLRRACLVGGQLVDGIEMAIGFVRDFERQARPSSSPAVPG